GPLYRYLMCLYESKFRVRSDSDLLRDVIELVGEQPDLMEATALLAQLYARTGDGARADLFARLALESPSPSARARALEVLQAHASAAGEPPPSGVNERGPLSTREPRAAPLSGTRLSEPPPVPVVTDAELDAWFDIVRRERVHRRSPTYGMKSVDSIV